MLKRIFFCLNTLFLYYKCFSKRWIYITLLISYYTLSLTSFFFMTWNVKIHCSHKFYQCYQIVKIFTYIGVANKKSRIKFIYCEARRSPRSNGTKTQCTFNNSCTTNSKVYILVFGLQN